MHEEMIREVLVERDPDFKKLFVAHYRCEKELNALGRITFKSGEETRKCRSLKRKKLELKDRMQGIINQYRGRFYRS